MICSCHAYQRQGYWTPWYFGDVSAPQPKRIGTEYVTEVLISRDMNEALLLSRWNPRVQHA